MCIYVFIKTDWSVIHNNNSCVVFSYTTRVLPFSFKMSFTPKKKKRPCTTLNVVKAANMSKNRKRKTDFRELPNKSFLSESSGHLKIESTHHWSGNYSLYYRSFCCNFSSFFSNRVHISEIWIYLNFWYVTRINSNKTHAHTYYIKIIYP